MKYLTGPEAQGLKCCNCGKSIIPMEGSIQFGKWKIEKWNQSLCFDCVYELEQLLAEMRK